jgi:predicted ATPase
VLIGGEAGVGKTRPLAEFTAAARGAGVQVLTGACLELGADGLPYSPFTAMLRELVRDSGADAVAALLSGSTRAARELTRLLPDLATSGTGVSGTGVSGTADMAGETPITASEARAHLFEGFLTLLERLAAQRPLLLIIEDAHRGCRQGPRTRPAHPGPVDRRRGR